MNDPKTVVVGKVQELVPFMRVEKHLPSRKNIKGQLVYCHEEKTGEYKYSKYLEQNRYSRLFVENELLGEGGFGKVYKVEHCLDGRQYAIKQIKIHLGVNEDFKKHLVYREIVGISQVQHKNICRYYACWIESVSADEKEVNKCAKKIERKMLKRQNSSDDSDFDLNDRTPMRRQNSGQNLLVVLNQESEIKLNEDYKNKPRFNREMFKGIDSSEDDNEEEEISDSESDLSEEKSVNVDSESSESESDGSDTESVESSTSLYQLIDKAKDFITLNVMIQMEHCTGETLREFLDRKDYKVNRKMVNHYFKQLISGLKHIHEEGLIHRDIKPANIFIDINRNLLKIGDFGLAKEQINLK